MTSAPKKLTPLRVGKVSPEIFAQVIRPRLGRTRRDVRVGPTHGVDVGVVDLGGGQVLVATTDPLYVVPAFGWERAAWFALHILASDAATSGFPPQYISVSLNLPPAMPDADLAAFWDGFHQACDTAGIAVITGHTGRYDGCTYPILGAATVLAVGPATGLVTPALVRPGDQVIVTKGPAIESVGQLGALVPEQIAAGCGKAAAREANALFDQMSVVTEARILAEAGVGDRGVTAMHDATEFGVWGALVEVADAANVGMIIDRTRLPMPAVVRDVCALFGMDPYTASSEGTLVATCRAKHAQTMITRLHDQGIDAAIVGEVLPRSAGVHVDHGAQPRAPLEYPQTDPFWPVLCAALRKEGRALDALLPGRF